MTDTCDIVVIGAGMAGMSVAAALASKAHVIVLEQEAQPGMHATGRSAALYAPGYGSGAVKALTHASREVFFNPDAAPALVKPRAAMFVATAAQLTSLEALLIDHSDTCRRISGAEACRRMPMLRSDVIEAAAFDESSADIDVNALLQFYRGRVRSAGGQLACDERVKLARADSRAWRIETPKREIRASVLINASGAWADFCAGLAGVSPVGIVPKRRTAALVDAPAATDFADWPAVIDIDERFYFKPDAGKLLVSPADETPVDPHDAYADDEALAEGIERICGVSTLQVTRAPRSWAGLRSFARDKSPVAGFDEQAAAPFYWLVGQGGYGIQMAPALATYAACEVLGSAAPAFAEPWLRAAVEPKRLRS